MLKKSAKSVADWTILDKINNMNPAQTQKLYFLAQINETTSKNFYKENSALFYSMAAIFVVLGILAFVYYFLTKHKIQDYKNEQLKTFRENHPKDKHKTYEQAGLYLPSWQRAKYNLPMFLGLVFVIIGIYLFFAPIMA